MSRCCSSCPCHFVGEQTALLGNRPRRCGRVTLRSRRFCSFVLFPRCLGLWAGLGSRTLGWRLILSRFHFTVPGAALCGLWGGGEGGLPVLLLSVGKYIRSSKANIRDRSFRSVLEPVAFRIDGEETSGTQWGLLGRGTAGCRASSSPFQLSPQMSCWTVLPEQFRGFLQPLQLNAGHIPPAGTSPCRSARLDKERSSLTCAHTVRAVCNASLNTNTCCVCLALIAEQVKWLTTEFHYPEEREMTIASTP
jgi:hypothetical protein